jgi:hypothetical protein
MRKLPWDAQVEYVKGVIKNMVDIYQDDTFSTEDIGHPPFRHRVIGKWNSRRVLSYLAELGEVEILKDDPNIIEFKIKEKFGKVPNVNIEVPVTEHIIKSFEEDLRRMMSAYALFVSFENKLRFFISYLLEQNKGPDWWETNVSKQVKDNIKTHSLHDWHIQLPKSNIQYTDFSDLIKIINKNWDLFEDVFKDQVVTQTYLESLEIPRNTIAHSNVLSESMFRELELYSSKILNLIDHYKPE